MSVNLKYTRLFAYSEEKSKYFFTQFGDDVSIVHGRNTSGKSTLFLSILYTFGINDGNPYLKDVLAEKVIFRLDCTLTKDGKTQNLTIIRDEDTLYVKYGSNPIKRFNGISSNNSMEHVKLKNFLNELFNFSLLLESKNEYKAAPMETLFLPYYVSQTVGWVYLRKSFSSLDFYKNFKEDYLDYYLGLDPSLDRVRRHELQAKLKTKQDELDLISTFETTDDDLQLTKRTDEQFIKKSNEYVEAYTKHYTTLTERENEYVLRCNELGYFEERKAVLKKVKKSHKEQEPSIGSCPTCSQSLPFGIEETYAYLQEQNDTDHELELVTAKIKDTQAKINSLQRSISEDRESIAKEYSVLNKYVNNGMSYDKWLKNKANTELLNTLNRKIGELTVERKEIEDDLKKYKTDEEIEKSRITQSNSFSSLFTIFLRELGVKQLEEDRYTRLYQISAFPSQGVELHKTIMAYHFAFVRLIADTANIHRLPFMLDAIFKEDIEDENKKIILKFISKNRPKDVQTILSVAQTKTQINNATTYNAEYFEGKAKLISIGEGEKERSFLLEYTDDLSEYLTETFDIINGTIR